VSSTILYLAIVAIWAGVLVPRWLRREPHREATSRSLQPSRPGGALPGELATDVPEGAGLDAGVAGLGSGAGSAVGVDPAMGGRRSRPSQSDGQSRDGQGRDGASQDYRGARRASGVVAARRRLFGLLAMLLAAAAFIAIAGLAAWWVVLPPAGMLAGYAMLLREAARADAERKFSRGLGGRAAQSAGAPVAAAGAADGSVAGAAAGPAASAAESTDQVDEAATARVIDLTARVGDELYDQYADAKLRAVGD